MMRPEVVDLFGEVPVTYEDIEHWLITVPRIDPGSRHADWYVKAYDVPGKIKAAKLAGRWEQMERRELPERLTRRLPTTIQR